LFFYAEFSYSLVNIYFEVPHDLCISKLLAEWMYTAPDRWIRARDVVNVQEAKSSKMFEEEE